MQAERHDALVIPKPRLKIIILSAVALLALGIGFAVYQKAVVAHRTAISAAQHRLNYLKAKLADIQHIDQDLGSQWDTFDATWSDASDAGKQRHDGYMAGTLSDAGAKALAQRELADIQAIGPILTSIQNDDTELGGIYQTLYGADAASALGLSPGK